MRRLFCFLTLLPCFAVYKVATNSNWVWVLVYLVVISLITYVLYWHDKRQARKSGWRVTEAHLHLAELLGGWPIAFIAQQRLRHKTRKRSFQIIYWVIVLFHQYLAIELAFGGPFRRILFSTN